MWPVPNELVPHQEPGEYKDLVIPLPSLSLHLQEVTTISVSKPKLSPLGSLKGMITAVLSSYSQSPPKSSYHDCLTISIFTIFSLLHLLFHEMANPMNFSVLIIFELPPETTDHSLILKTLSFIGFPHLPLLFFILLFFWHSSERQRFCVFLP